MDHSFMSLLCPDWRGSGFIVDCATWQVQYANLTCLNSLKDSQILRIVNGRLAFESTALKRKFALKADQAFKMGAETTTLIHFSEQTGTALSLRLCFPKGLMQDVILQMSPDREMAKHIAVVEFSQGKAHCDNNSFQELAETLRLSNAERIDLNELLRGKTLNEIAESRGIAVSTVRQRIKSIMAKARCSRQVELTLMVQGLCQH